MAAGSCPGRDDLLHATRENFRGDVGLRTPQLFANIRHKHPAEPPIALPPRSLRGSSMSDTRDEFGFRSLSMTAQQMLTAIRSQFAADDRASLLGRMRFARRPERDRIIDAAFTLRRVVGEAARRIEGDKAPHEPALRLMDRYLMQQAVRDEAFSIIADPKLLRRFRGIDAHAAWSSRAVRD